MVEEKLLQIFSPAYSDITNLFISKYKVNPHLLRNNLYIIIYFVIQNKTNNNFIFLIQLFPKTIQ